MLDFSLSPELTDPNFTERKHLKCFCIWYTHLKISGRVPNFYRTSSLSGTVKLKSTKDQLDEHMSLFPV